ncbi:hypothetical protein [Fodinibius halophilus]|uniref:Carboxypeptidase regulatory-like domain-containing protein n=1 Tax=Fodinibius halophilus TaxID=1736908 RepID=A0A6M1TI15_9BACT|nr:hypothetical protein [Fodinibius halophilus]NGP89722.1 hypothetical protein [Fodinibius halophilus]
MRRSTIIIFASVTLLFISACSNSSGPTDRNLKTIIGQVKAPDNSTPVEGATVYIGKPMSDSSGKEKAVPSTTIQTSPTDKDCPKPEVEHTAYTCTKADGRFEFEADIDPSKSEVELKIFKGQFYFTQTVDLGSGDTSEAGTINISTDDIDIAVVASTFDRMQDVLAKVGFGEVYTDENHANYGKLKRGTETFDLYHSPSSLGGDYPLMGKLFEDGDGNGQADIHNYDIVFLNCGVSDEYIQQYKSHRHKHAQSAQSSNPQLSKAQISTIRNYVEQGGMLYATDLAYNYVEQVFPSYLDFLGSPDTPADEAEILGVASKGTADIEVPAELLDANMKTWLQNVECANGPCLEEGQPLTIKGFMPIWVVLNGKHESSNANIWVKGPVEWSDGSGVKPLTATFGVGSGKVVFSSYHTIEEEHSHKLRPQERILQYLVFE